MDRKQGRRHAYFSQEHLSTGAGLLQNEIDAGVHILGYDSEFTQQKDGKQVLSLIQIATNDVAYLFHVHGVSVFPLALERILKNDKVAKIGFGLGQDYKVMFDTFCLHISCLDLQTILLADTGKTFSLKEAVEKYCQYTMQKHHNGIHWQWAGELDESRRKYAADDAFACRDLWDVLRPTKTEKQPSPPVSVEREYICPFSEEVKAKELEKAFKWMKEFPPTSGPKETFNKLFNSFPGWQVFNARDKEYMCRLASEKYHNRESSYGKTNEDRDIDAIKKFLPTFWSGEPRQKDKISNHIANSCSGVSFASLPLKDKKIEAEKLINIMIERGYLSVDRGFISHKFTA